MTIQVDTGGSVRTLLVVDCTRAEEVSLEAQASLHEIEDGSPITDHVIKRGRGFQLQGVVSDYPINLTQAAIGNAGGHYRQRHRRCGRCDRNRRWCG